MEEITTSLEYKLEIAGLRSVVDFDRQKVEVASLIRQGLDWGKFIENAIRNRIAPIIYYNLKQQGLLGLFPSKIREALQNRFLLCQRHNFAVEQAMSEVLNDLSSKMQIIALKGIALSQTVYNNLGIREFCDVDLLIRYEDLNCLEHILVDKWKMICKDRLPIGRTYYADSDSKCRYNQIMIDVAWEIIQADRFNFAIDWKTDSVWENSLRITIYGQPLRMLSLEDLISYQVYHLGFHHKFRGLLWYVDLLKIFQTKREEISWDKIIQQSRLFGISGITYKILSFLNNKLDAQIPIRHLDRLRAQASSFSLRQLGKFDIEDGNFSRLGFRNEFFPPLIFDRPGQTIKVFYRLLFPSLRWLRENFSENSKDATEYSKVGKIILRIRWWFLYLGWSKRYLRDKEKLEKIGPQQTKEDISASSV